MSAVSGVDGLKVSAVHGVGGLKVSAIRGIGGLKVSVAYLKVAAAERRIRYK